MNPPNPSNPQAQADIDEFKKLMENPYMLDKAKSKQTILRIGDARAIQALFAILHAQTATGYVGGYYETQRQSLIDHSLEIMAQVGAPAVEPLIRALEQATNAKSSLLIDPILTALGRLGDRRATGKLLAILKNKRLRQHAYPAIAALAEIGDPKAVKPLLGIVDKGAHAKWQKNSKDRERMQTATRAARGLGKIGDPRALPSLIHAFKRADSVLAKDIAPVLEELGESATLVRLGWHKDSILGWNKPS